MLIRLLAVLAFAAALAYLGLTAVEAVRPSMQAYYHQTEAVLQ